MVVPIINVRGKSTIHCTLGALKNYFFVISDIVVYKFNVVKFVVIALLFVVLVW